ncbi:MAG TPA: methyltransferase domain-containing protein [Sporichthyaceae bacterium]|nr:methyltransferase domain-containing protein [Sporichthyaceae bacterium]
MSSSRAQVRAAVRRRRRALLRSLPTPVVRRARFLKWAVLGAPPAKKSKAKTTKAKSTQLPAVGEGPTDLPKGRTQLDMRRQILGVLGDLSEASILEIGPGFAPIFAKREGYRTKVVDHTDRAGLENKYESHGYSSAEFEEVDFVLLAGGKMADEVGEQFDLVIASHVIEHSTSIIDFVNEGGKLLRPGGRLAFVVPDKRFCFDRFRERSSLGAVIDASLQPADRHSLGTLTDQSVNAVVRGKGISWSPSRSGSFRKVHDLDHARVAMRTAAAGDEYVDVHHWVFTPHHLRLLFADLADLGYISLHETMFHETVGSEFYIVMSADGVGPGLSRAELVARADAELAVPGPLKFAAD